MCNSSNGWKLLSYTIHVKIYDSTKPDLPPALKVNNLCLYNIKYCFMILKRMFEYISGQIIWVRSESTTLLWNYGVTMTPDLCLLVDLDIDV